MEQFECETCGGLFDEDKIDGYGDCPECARENQELARAMDHDEFPELRYAEKAGGIRDFPPLWNLQEYALSREVL